MPLNKQGINIPFGQGLDTKTDPNQVSIGKMLALQNIIFDKGAQLHKRDGFGLLATLPVETNTVLSTHNLNLISTGKDLYAYNTASDTWSDRGTIQPVGIDVQPLVRDAKTKTNPCSAVAANGLVCTTYGDGSAVYYQITQNGQIIKAQTALPTGAEVPTVEILGNNFCIIYNFLNVNYSLKCLTIPIATPTAAGTTTTLQSTTVGLNNPWGVTVANNTLYFAWNDIVAGTLFVNWMNSALQVGAAQDTGKAATMVSVTADVTGKLPIVWVSGYDSSIKKIYSSAWSFHIAYPPLLAATLIVTTSEPATYMASAAADNVLTLFYSTLVSGKPLYIAKHTCTLAGTASAATVIRRSVGVASKPFFLSDGSGYIFAIYSLNDTSLQPTYFLLDFSGNILARIAPSNASLSQFGPHPVPVINDIVYFTYAVKDFVASINTKEGGVQAPGGLFSLNGVNLATITINDSPQYSSEIGGSLHLTGGQLWQYDGTTPVEHGFHVFPEGISLAKTNSTGTIANGTYYYKVCYEWTDAAGNIHRSAPSLPVGIVLDAAEDTITVTLPTLSLTAKTNVRIVCYRWSLAQQTYYMVSSITSPTLNDPTTDTVTFTDTNPDANILGNTILYTNGNVVENIAAPASYASALFKGRLFIIYAENRNLLGYSKQVIEATPVEMSDLFTIYVAPTSGAQGSTGPMTALSAMDDKLIIFKKDAIYYLTGTGPDNTGANNDFNDPVYISGTVGCANQKSIVQTPLGLMFQSDKGIWLLGRDLSTMYIGAPVEDYNTQTIVSGLTIPGSNQVRFTLENGAVLMYDYYFQQWCTFSGIPGLSSCLYNGLHTYLNRFGQVLQETKNRFLDNTTPVTIKFTTAWIKLTDLQGFQRAYFFYLLGKYVSPHKLGLSIAYDYDPSIKQTIVFTPSNTINVYGENSPYGSGPYGGESTVEQFRVFLSQQKCQAIQITVEEAYDSTQSKPAGGGLTLSGINMVIGAKKGYPVLRPSKSVG